MIAVTKVTRNFQITIPEVVREELGISMGDTIGVEHDKTGFRLHKLKQRPIKDFKGALGNLNVPSSTELQKMWRKEFERKP